MTRTGKPGMDRNVLLLVFGLVVNVKAMNDCYNPSTLRPQVCLPPFVNAAFGREVIASNTCGLTQPQEFCLQTGVTGVRKSCHYCYAKDARKHHNPEYLTDMADAEPTWWQSETMLHPVQFPDAVNLTLDLGKAFDITYVRLRFHSARPQSFAIYKKSCDNCEWEPYQYYSGTCHATYQLDNEDVITSDNEKKALCTEDYSNISPLTGGNVAFSTLEGRPSATRFDKSTILQDWVTATSIRITLNRINTFGDEVFSDSKVLKSYYYAISDFAVGGRCKCNGHASQCILGDNNKLMCVCEHHTTGVDCDICEPLYNNKPWNRGGDGDAHPCEKCDCNGLADECVFDEDLYRQTGGDGGRCVGCRDNTAGVHCELCLPNHYRDSVSKRCVACGCDVFGSTSSQCDANGQCTCKPGVGGEQCDRCREGYFGFSESGCSQCNCQLEGTEPGTVCNPNTGACVCKLNVEGEYCDRCKPGSMNLQGSNPYGCTACFCYGHSSICSVAGGYTKATISDNFDFDEAGWRGSQYSIIAGDGRISLDGGHFQAPGKYLGEQRFSYNQMLSFDLSVAPDTFLDTGSGNEPLIRASTHYDDIVLQGDQYRVAASLVDMGNPSPSTNVQTYTFRLHEAAGFYPRLSAFQFQKMLNELHSIEIRADLMPGGFTELHGVRLETAELGGLGEPADWIEYCDAEGYLDASAESCSPGYTRDPPDGGRYSPCEPCQCNGHGQECDPETGVCVCQDNTAGDHCEVCEIGYYKDSVDNCTPCPCPNHIACAVADDGKVKCLSCPPGHMGDQCEYCMDGWFGDPRGLGECQRCNCNDNIDMNAIGNCDSRTGECLKCIYNTTGVKCQQCLPGYFGKPLSDVPEDRCRACDCYQLGSSHSGGCDVTTGQCQCLPFVTGRSCNQCQDGYYDLQSGDGCAACNCDRLGATTGECDQGSGQCECKPGVTGQHCDRCQDDFYALTNDGCSSCDCNEIGSAHGQCGEDGRCVCKEGVLGAKCDQCEENYYDISSGCIECPACYGLVKNAVATQRDELARLETLTSEIGDKPARGGEDFELQLEILNNTIASMFDGGIGADALNERVEKQQNYQERMRDLWVELTEVQDNVQKCAGRIEEANSTVFDSIDLLTATNDILDSVRDQLAVAKDNIERAQAIADASLSKEDNMTRLADEAEAIAQRQEELSNTIVQTAQNALDTSRGALDAINQAIDTLNTLNDVFGDISDSRLPGARELRDELSRLAEQVLNKTIEAKTTSTALFTEAEKLAGLLPKHDVDSLDQTSQSIIERSNALLPQINDLENEFLANQAQLDADIARAENLMSTADHAQDSADMLLAQVHSAHARAQTAVENGNAAYESVLQVKTTLEEFDDLIAKNRANADEAMLMADDIQDTIDIANTKTKDAQNALGSARSTAEQARDKAQQAQTISEDVQAKAQSIRDQAEAAHNSSVGVQDSLADIDTRIDAASVLIDDAKQQSDEDAVIVGEATEAAALAKAQANAVKDKVDKLLNDLQEILVALANIDDVDEDELQVLEDELAGNKKLVDEANIPASMEELEQALADQEAALSQYDDDISKLKADIENLEQIERVLPVECQKTIKTEIP